MRGAYFATIHPTKIVNIRQIATFAVGVSRKKKKLVYL